MAQTKVRFDRAVEGATNIVDSGTEGTKVAAGTTAQRGSTTGQWRFNTTTGYFEGINNSGEFSTLEPTPTVTSVDITEVDSQAGGNQTVVVTGTNFTSGGTIAFVGSSATFNASTTTYNNATQVTAVAPKVSFLNAQEPYKVRFTSPSGVAGTSSTGLISVDTAPTFNVASGSLGTLANTDRVSSNLTSVTATDPDGDAVTFSKISGTLPTGITFNSNGTFSGTANAETSNTTYTFTIRATANSKTSDRQYTITVNAPQGYAYSYTGSTQTWSKPTGLTSVTAYVWGAGGGGGGNSHGNPGGSGGYAKAVIDVSSLSNLYLVVGQGGFGGGSNHTGGSGGGLSGIFDNSLVNHGDSILIAGSGGGGAGAVGSNAGGGGYGGGANNSGNDGTRDTRVPSEKTEGSGGSTSAGGSAGNSSSASNYANINPTAGSALTGGNNGRPVSGNTLNASAFAQGGRAYEDAGDGAWLGGAGGSGYYGGGGGTNGYAGGGGGGSGYAKSSVTSSVVGTNGTQGSSSSYSQATAPETSSIYYASGIAVGGATENNGGNGRIVLVY